MRAVPVLFCSILVTLAACAGREQVKAGYVGTASMDQQQVSQLLSQQGYTDITGLHQNGPDWVGEATKGGQTVTFDIDKDGTIHTK